MKSKFSVILRAGISVGLVVFLLWSMRSHFPRIADTLAQTNLLIFSLAVGFFLFNIIIASFRLNLLFVGEGISMPPGKIIQLSFIGFFFNNFMPTAVGGDIVKAYYVHKETGKTAKSFISVFMDRFIGLFSFVCLGAFALLLSWKTIDGELKNIVLIFALGGIAGFFIILNTHVAKVMLSFFSKLKLWNLGERLSRVYRAVHEYRNKKNVILKVMGISLITQSIYFSIIYFLSVSIAANVPLKTVFLIMPVVSVVSMLPSLGGLGLREGAMVALFGPVIGAEAAFSISILLLVTLLIASLIGGFIYLFASQFKIKKAEISKIESYSV